MLRPNEEQVGENFILSAIFGENCQIDPKVTGNRVQIEIEGYICFSFLKEVSVAGQ